MFERIRKVEQIGSRIRRMRDLMIEANLTEPKFNTERIFTVTDRRSFHFNKWVDNFTDNRVNIIKAIHENSKVSKGGLEEKVDLSATAIDNNLDALKDLGFISRVGGAKGAIGK